MEQEYQLMPPPDPTQLLSRKLPSLEPFRGFVGYGSKAFEEGASFGRH